MMFDEDVSNASFDLMEAQAVFSNVYRFFDETIVMKSDQAGMVDWFRQLYARFRIEEQDCKAGATYYLLAETQNGPCIVAEEHARRTVKTLEDKRVLPFYAYFFALKYIATQAMPNYEFSQFDETYKTSTSKIVVLPQGTKG